MKYVILFLFPISLFSQSIVVSGGVGSYKMSDIKEFRDYAVSYVPLELNLEDDFPPHLFWSVKFFVESDGLEFGLGYSYYTTGSRYTISDYSGRCDMDFILNGHAIVLPLKTSVVDKGVFDLGFYFNIECVFSQLKLKENIEIYDESINDETVFTSVNIGGEPGGYIEWPINNFSLILNAGYNLSFASVLKTEENDEVMIKPDENIYTDWSGFRVELAAAYHF